MWGGPIVVKVQRTVAWKVWILVWEGGFCTEGCEVSKCTVGVALWLPSQNPTSFPLSHSRGRRKGWAFVHLHYWASGEVAQ